LNESKGEREVTIDWAGAILLVTSLISLLLTPVLHQTEGYAWSNPKMISLYILGTALLSLFVWVEVKSKEPILPLHLFMNRNFVVISALVFVFILAVMGSLSSFPFFAQNVLGLTPTEAGYLTIPMMVGAVGASVLAGRLMPKIPYRNLYGISFIIPIIGFYLLSGIDAHTSIPTFILYFIILGFGFGALFNNSLIVQESVEKEHVGIAQSSVNLFQSIGMTIGFSLFGSLLASKISSGMKSLAGNLSMEQALSLKNMENGTIPKNLNPVFLENIKTVFSQAFQHLYWVSFVLAIVSFFICWGLKKEVLIVKKEEKENVEDSEKVPGISQ
jgi:MFS family permease